MGRSHVKCFYTTKKRKIKEAKETFAGNVLICSLS